MERTINTTDEMSFEALAMCQLMENRGIEHSTAEAIAIAVDTHSRTQKGKLATNDDLKDVKTEIKELRAEVKADIARLEAKIEVTAKNMIIWIGGMVLALGGSMIAILMKYLPVLAKITEMAVK